jgi:nicotinamidase-related amidase
MKDASTSRRAFLVTSAAGCLAGGALARLAPAADAKAERELALPVRRQRRIGDSDRFVTESAVLQLPPRETAVLICDMWNQHWCASASRRCGAIAARMAPLVEAARASGLRIVHSPSDTLEFYKNHPARKRALAVSLVDPPVKIANWCSLEEAREGKLPIDDSDGGCDCQPQCKQGSPWTRQHAAIRIDDADFLSDDGKEVYSYFVHEGVKNVIFMGEHTNMCVLGRSFGIRQMTKLKMNAVLVRDLTDTMYNPRMSPKVPHDQGTELVIAHVERHWCPTTDSTALSAGLAG